jgi:SAM-dependent methyltransferase
MSRDHWEKQASNWAAWARKPGFDSYWTYAETFFELLPAAGKRTLEVGCGEGRVSRDLKARGHHVVAVDASPTLIQMAHEVDASIEYARCDARALPFRDQSFDLAVFYNSLMDFDEMEASVAEASRILRPGGAFCASITHPMQDAGKFASRSGDAPFVIEGSYLGGRRVIDAEVERDGHRMHFKGWAYPLETYSRALERAGLAIQALREPAALQPPPSMDPGAARWRRIPVFLMWRAVKA